MELQKSDAVSAAVQSMASRLQPIGTECIPVVQAAGRILAEPLLADRDSPAVDVSAMDGYALRMQDVAERVLTVAGTCAAGAPPQKLPEHQALQIFTGACVPSGSDLVIRREDTLESPETVTLNVSETNLQVGQHIRRRGENIRRGEMVLEAGTLLSSSALGAVAAFGNRNIQVRRKLRVIVLNTGDELASMGESVQPWQIRDSNGPVLQSWLSTKPWIEFLGRRQVADNLGDVIAALRTGSETADVLVLTGGVSMGDADYVPDAIRAVQGEIIFHRLPIRPGKPVLAAKLNETLVLGLPGNPVSVAVTARRIALPLLEKMVAAKSTTLSCRVEVENPDDNPIDLTWYRLVEPQGEDRVRLVSCRGSGDLVALARSSGFVEYPPGATGSGPWRLYTW